MRVSLYQCSGSALLTICTHTVPMETEEIFPVLWASYYWKKLRFMRCARLPVRMAQQGGLLIFTCRAHVWETVSGWFYWALCPGGLSFSQVELFVALKSGTLMSHKSHRQMSDGERCRKAGVQQCSGVPHSSPLILTPKQSSFANCNESATVFSY